VFQSSIIEKGFAVKIHQGALLLATGIAIGALTSGVLRAQNPPPAFTIAEIQVTDPEAFKDYASATGVGIPAAGGRFIVRSGKSFVINGEHRRVSLLSSGIPSIRRAPILNPPTTRS
jgi:hypothetical protein